MCKPCKTLLCAIIAAGALGAQPAERVDGTPLWRARLALEMARARVVENRYTDASASLRDAATALADFARDFPGPHAETAAFIRQKMEAYAPNLAGNPTDALDRIDLWRQPVERWYGETHKAPPQ